MSIASLNKPKFLALLGDWHSHTVYYPETVVSRLVECGLSARVADNGGGIYIENEFVGISEPEWGDPGISPLSVLAAVYELIIGSGPESQMSGRGFWYQDVTDQLRAHWNVTTKET